MRALAVIIIMGLVLVLVNAEEPAPAIVVPVVGEMNVVTGVTTNTPAKPKEPTVVTSDRLQVDYAHNLGTFTGNVLAMDAQISVRADQMVVVFGTTTNGVRTLQKITAEGGVMINQGDRKSSSERAVYTAADGKVVLTGKPKLQSPEGTLTGKTITFWRDQQKVDIESDTRLVIYPDELKKDRPVEQPVEPPK